MRWITAALLVVALLPAYPVNAVESERASYSIDLDWSKNEAQKEAAEFLQSKGLLPKPIVRINGTWRTLLPATTILPENDHVQIAVGITQFVERPLYIIELNRRANGSFRVWFNYPEFTVRQDYKGIEHAMGALVIKSLTQSKEFNLSPGGKIELPADPYASIVMFAKNQKFGLKGIGKIPVLQEDGGKLCAPFVTTFGKYDFDIKQFMAGDVPHVCKHNIDEQWVLATWRDPLRPEAPEPIRLISKPLGASIFVAGYFQGAMTEATLEEPRNLWSEIILRKHGFADCSVDSGKVVTNSGQPATFRCALMRQ